jgi:serine protease inhibitor
MSKGLMEAADFGIKAIMAISEGVIEEANINASNIINQANVTARNTMRSANNELRSKQGSLARYTKSINNQRVLANTASAAEAAIVNYRRSRDSATTDDFEQQIAFAEQAGAQAAASALSGLTGGVVDIVNGTTALRKARLQQRTADATRMADFDAAARTKQIMQAGYDNLDFSDIIDGLDSGNDVFSRRVYTGTLLGDLIKAKTGTNMANVLEGTKAFFTPSNNPIGPSGIPYGTES